MRASSLPCVRLMFALCRFAEPELDLLLCLGVQHAQRLAQVSLFQWLLTVSPASSLGAMLIFATLVNSQQSEKSLFGAEAAHQCMLHSADHPAAMPQLWRPLRLVAATSVQKSLHRRP